MPNFQVYISVEVSKMVEIEAENQEDAERIANEKWDYTNDIQFDCDEDYVPDSFKVNFIESEY